MKGTWNLGTGGSDHDALSAMIEAGCRLEIWNNCWMWKPARPDACTRVMKARGQGQPLTVPVPI